MKKLILLFLFTTIGYGQVSTGNEQYFDYGTQTAPTSLQIPSTVNYLGTYGTDGTSGRITPLNVTIPYVPMNYSILTQTLGGQFAGIDNKFASVTATTAGISTRVWFTADGTTVGGNPYYQTQVTKGATASAIQSVVNDDNQKKYFTQDLIGAPFVTATLFPPGTYAGNLSASTTPNSAQQRWTVELYKCDNNGTPIASGVTGAPVGDLGVTVILILDSGLLTLADGSVTNVQVSGVLGTGGLSMAVGQRIRYHVSAEKVGTAASNITQSVYYGNSYNSFLDVPVPLNTTAVKNLSLVFGDTSTDAFNTLNTAVIGKLDKLDTTPPFTETIPYKSYTSFGDSYTFGAYVNYPSNKYPNIIGSFLNIAPYNFGVSSNQAADEQVKIYSQSISSSGNELNTTIIGSNDITGYGGDLDKQDNYKNIYSASLAWLGIPNKQIGQSANITYTGSWTNSTRFGGTLSKQSNTNGNKASFVINGTKAYISYCMIDGNGGTFTVTVDGVPTGVTYNCFGKNGTAISTLLGHTYGSGLIRITGLTDANHTIELTVTSATSASNVVQFDWGGTNKGINTVGKPTTIIGKIVRRFSATYIDDYNALIESIYNDLAVTDGMNFHLIETDYVLDIPTDLASDNAHPNDSGMRKIAQPFIDKILELYPQSTPTNVFSSTDKIDFNAKESIFKNKLVLKPVDAKFEDANVSGQLADAGLWTSTDWTGSLSAGFVHTAGNLSPLTSTKKVVPGSLYAVSFGFEGSSAGSVDVYLGGVKIGSALNIGIYNLSCKANTDEGLIFIPTTDFVSRINDIEYIEVYGGSEAQLSFEATDGTVNNEIRVQKSLNNFSFGIGAGSNYYRASNNFNGGYMANYNGVNTSFSLNLGTFAGFEAQGKGGIHLAENSGYWDSGDYNTTIGRNITGDMFNKFELKGNRNLILGTSALVSDLDASYQFSIMNGIYGINMTGTNTGASSAQSGKIGLFIRNPLAPLHLALSSNATETIGGVSMGRGMWIDVTSSRSGITVNSSNGSLASYGGNGFFSAIVPFDTFSTDRTFKPFRLQTGLATLTDRFYITGYGEGYFQNAVSIGSTSLSQMLNVAGGGVFSAVRASAGNGLIVDYDGTSSRLTSYFYTGGLYKPMEFNALSFDWKTSASSKMTLTSSALTVGVPAALSGDSTSITPTAGDNDTSIATTAFVTGGIATADAGNMKLTGNQVVAGQKNFNDTLGSVFTSIQASKSNTSGSLVDIQTGATNAGGILLNVSSTTGNAVTNVSKLVVINAGSSSVGMPLSIQNAGTDTFTVNKTGDAVVNTVTLNSVLKLKAYTVGTLPVGTVGDMAYVTDALAPTYNVTVVGGGAIRIPVFYNGTNWTAH